METGKPTGGAKQMTITIKSQKGTSINLAVDSKGFVTATVNGIEHRGTDSDHGVRMFGSKHGNYLQITNGVAALIDTADIGAARDFFAAAKRLADAAINEAALAKHQADMLNPAYAAEIAHYRLMEDMGRANSKH